MAGLQVLEAELTGQGFRVLAFFSNDFGAQGGNPEQIAACNTKYGVTFQEFAIDHVNTVDNLGAPVTPQDVWQWIHAQPSPGPENGIAPTWNFHKYLVSRQGALVAHYGRDTYWGETPGTPQWDDNDVIQGIMAELAK
jgi:glutathione peroxidase